MTTQLEQLQRWMQTVIMHPDGVRAGLESEAARQELDIAANEIEQVITRSQALTSVERLEVYGNAYYARLIECMAAEFPATEHLVGEDAFSGFVFGYLQELPSTSYTLGELGVGFADYLATSRPARDSDQPDWADFLVDLATLERAYSDVFDGPGEEQRPLLTAEQLQAISPDKWDSLRLETADSLRLLRFRFPVQEYAAAVRKQESATIPEAKQTFLAISRRDYIVRRRVLEPLPFELLSRLQSGSLLGIAIVDSLEAHGSPPDNLSALLEEWFRTWTAAGYFIAVG